MKLLSIGQTILHQELNIISIQESDLSEHPDLETYAYIIISGGDGTIRRVMKQLQTLEKLPTFILNPMGSFNVIAKLHRVPKINVVLDMLANGKIPSVRRQQLSKLNEEIFLFSAGNMGDLQHIFLSETLRFGLLKRGIFKYILAGFFLFPAHLIITPFMLLSSRHFFIFTPVPFIKKFGNFYGLVKEMTINLEHNHNFIELDGDVVHIQESQLHIKPAGHINIVTR